MLQLAGSALCSGAHSYIECVRIHTPPGTKTGHGREGWRRNPPGPRNRDSCRAPSCPVVANSRTLPAGRRLADTSWSVENAERSNHEEAGKGAVGGPSDGGGKGDYGGDGAPRGQVSDRLGGGGNPGGVASAGSLVVLPPLAGAHLAWWRRNVQPCRFGAFFDVAEAANLHKIDPRSTTRRTFNTCNHRTRNERKAVPRPESDGIL